MSFDRGGAPTLASTTQTLRRWLHGSLVSAFCSVALLAGSAAQANSAANSFAQLLGLTLSVEDLTPADGQAASFIEVGAASGLAWVHMLGKPEREDCCGLFLSSTLLNPGKLFARSEVKVSGLAGTSFFLATEANGVEGEVVSGSSFTWNLELAPGTRLTASSTSSVSVQHVGTPSPGQLTIAGTSLSFLGDGGWITGIDDGHFLERTTQGQQFVNGKLTAIVENSSDSPLTVTLLATTHGFVTSVPEPATLAFFGPGLLALWWRARKR
jgi:hypothetical protein